MNGKILLILHQQKGAWPLWLLPQKTSFSLNSDLSRQRNCAARSFFPSL
uniref:Uncharacterized protein n=1 Tax=Anguilla anguilla TaxID=7936 RepID=A0A0E9UT97_ANGAN